MPIVPVFIYGDAYSFGESAGRQLKIGGTRVEPELRLAPFVGGRAGVYLSGTCRTSSGEFQDAAVDAVTRLIDRRRPRVHGLRTFMASGSRVRMAHDVQGKVLIRARCSDLHL